MSKQRLINADALKEKTLAHGERIAYVVSFLWDIDDSPTIDAIPVEWMRGLKEKLYGNSNGLAYRMLLDVILNMWQKEQEAR